MTDAAKPLWIEKTFFPQGARRALLFADGRAAAHFAGRLWMAAALADFGIEVCLVTLPDNHQAAVASAQQRHFR